VLERLADIGLAMCKRSKDVGLIGCVLGVVWGGGTRSVGCILGICLEFSERWINVLEGLAGCRTGLVQGLASWLRF
jgi:hypothetical protein